MGRLQALSLAGIIALGAAPVVHAADLLPPPPQLEPYNAPLESSGWYLRGDVGVGEASLRQGTSISSARCRPASPSTKAICDNSAFVGLGAGYQFNNWFRADITGEYRTSQRYQAIESYNNSGNAHCGRDATTPITARFKARSFSPTAISISAHWYGLDPLSRWRRRCRLQSRRRPDDVGSDQRRPSAGQPTSDQRFRLGPDGRHELRRHAEPEARSRLSLSRYGQREIRRDRLRADSAVWVPDRDAKISYSPPMTFASVMRWMFGEAAPEPLPEPIPPAPLVRKY